MNLNTLKIAVNEPQYSVCRFAAFLCLFFATWGLWWWWLILWFGDGDEHALHIVVSDDNIEIHLPLVCPFNKFIDIFLKFRYVIQVASSVAKFGIFCKLRHFTDNIGI